MNLLSATSTASGDDDLNSSSSLRFSSNPLDIDFVTFLFVDDFAAFVSGKMKDAI